MNNKNWLLAALLGVSLVVGPTTPADAATKRPSVAKADEKIKITSDYMKYDRKAKMALATGNVVILQEDTTIQTAEVQFDQGNKISYMNRPVHVVQKKEKEPKTTLDSQRMTTFHKDKRIMAEGDVRMVRSKDPYAQPKGKGDKSKVEAAIKKEDTYIKSNNLEYWTVKKDATFNGNVVILNGQKKAWGDKAVMENAKNLITLDGHVKVIQINGNWLVKEKIVKADSPDEARDEALRERATLTSDKLVMDQNTNNAVATGQVVRVEQKGKVATGRRAVFDDKTSTITMTENVRIQQVNGVWLTASKAVFHTDSEVFEAFSGGSTQVQTEFEVPDQKKPANGERVQMEFDVNETEK
jgi:lipopolysaccharide assembly outer membrane protein LptD (OstA)